MSDFEHISTILRDVLAEIVCRAWHMKSDEQHLLASLLELSREDEEAMR